LPELTVRVVGSNEAGTPERIELALDHPVSDDRYVFLVFLANTFRRVASEDLEGLHSVPPASLLEFLDGQAGPHPTSEVNTTMVSALCKL
jgi:hypothetical protein